MPSYYVVHLIHLHLDVSRQLWLTALTVCFSIILHCQKHWALAVFFSFIILLLLYCVTPIKSPLTFLFLNILICFWDIWFAIQLRSVWCANLTCRSKGYWMPGDFKEPPSTPFQSHSLSVPLKTKSEHPRIKNLLSIFGSFGSVVVFHKYVVLVTHYFYSCTAHAEHAHQPIAETSSWTFSRVNPIILLSPCAYSLLHFHL